MRKTILACVAVALIAGTTTATAATLITGKEIKDGSISGRDLKDGSVKSADLSKGVRSQLGAGRRPGWRARCPWREG